jgi:alkaline phosphatase
MMTKHRFGYAAWVLMLAVMVSGPGPVPAGEVPRNVILMIGDGMGVEHIKAAGFFSSGKTGSLFMETLPRQAMVVTCPAYTVSAGDAPGPAKVTDSAAAASAMATGRKVYNGVLSVALPGDGAPLKTVLEQAAATGKRTGIVTTSYLTDATPAAFGAHVKDRDLHREIAVDFLNVSRPNVILGGASKKNKVPLTPETGKAAGYRVVSDRAGLAVVVKEGDAHVLGLFGVGAMCYEYDFATTTRKEYDTLPHLSEMTTAALDLLAGEPKGFFLMIEGACIDKASHNNQLERSVYETLEFDKAVQKAGQWAANRKDTLLIVTADHETGGLNTLKGNGKGRMPDVKWSGSSHSGANVPLFATGPGSEAIAGILDNTDVARLVQGTFTGPTRYTPPAALAGGSVGDAGMNGD